MTATVSADLYALRMLLANGRECADSPRVLRLTIGAASADTWILALDAACEELDRREEAPRRAEAATCLDVMSRDEWLRVIHDERGRRRSNRELARLLGCNPTTVRRHLALHEIPGVLDELQREFTIYQGEGDHGSDVECESIPQRVRAIGDGRHGG
jgi:hypothetical protein